MIAPARTAPSRPAAPRRAALLRLAPLAALALAAGACRQGDYPSLAQRPAEREAPPPPAPATAPPAPDPAIATRLAGLVAEAQTAHAAFLAAKPAAAARVAAAHGAAPASEPWAAATESLSALATTRGPTVTALATLDRMQSDDTLAGGGADSAAITAARDAVAALADDEQATLAALNADLR